MALCATAGRTCEPRGGGTTGGRRWFLASWFRPEALKGCRSPDTRKAGTWKAGACPAKLASLLVGDLPRGARERVATRAGRCPAWAHIPGATGSSPVPATGDGRFGVKLVRLTDDGGDICQVARERPGVLFCPESGRPVVRGTGRWRSMVSRLLAKAEGDRAYV